LEPEFSIRPFEFCSKCQKLESLKSNTKNLGPTKVVCEISLSNELSFISISQNLPRETYSIGMWCKIQVQYELRFRIIPMRNKECGCSEILTQKEQTKCGCSEISIHSCISAFRICAFLICAFYIPHLCSMDIAGTDGTRYQYRTVPLEKKISRTRLKYSPAQSRIFQKNEKIIFDHVF
jgi:hypothetical protein